jgi:hypothetical protein
MCISLDMPYNWITLSKYCSAFACMWNFNENKANSYHLSELFGSFTNMFTYSRSVLSTS